MRELLWRPAFVTTALVVVAATLGTTGHAETTIGRWCDRMVPTMPTYNRIITIRLNATGAAEAHSLFGDGSEMTQGLHEVSGNVFAVLDSPSNDRSRIVPSSGELQLIDNDGLIRVARRLGNTRTPGECGL